MLKVTLQGCETTHKEVIKRAKAELRVTTTPGIPDAAPVTFNTFLLPNPSTAIVPTQWAQSTFPCLTVQDARPAPTTTSFKFLGTLKTDLKQPEAAEAVVNSLKKQGACILSLKVGMGKTCVALHVASTLQAKTLVVVHKTFLADQWEQRAMQFTPAAKVTRVQGQLCDLSGDIVVATIQTLVKKDAEMFGQFKLVVLDECHHTAAPMFSKAMFKLNCKYVLGLSATPTRKDGLQKVLHYFLGPIAYQVEGQTKAQRPATVMHFTYTCDAYAFPAPTTRFGTLDHTKLLNCIAENTQRTEAVVNLLRHVVPKNRHVLVLSHRRAHCEAIAAACPEASTYLGGDKKIPSSRILVSTYNLVSEGFDEARLDALVLATPASDVEQTVGRVLRNNDAKDPALIYDIIDAWGPCYAQSRKRKGIYTKNGFVITGPKALPSSSSSSAAGFMFLSD
jgi:superfamily II DNA or RNA helicase